MFCTLFFVLKLWIVYNKQYQKGDFSMHVEKTLPDKAVKFAARVLKLHLSLMKECNEPVISEQFIQDTVEIGIHIHEAQLRRNSGEIAEILTMALDKAAAVEYWINLLFSAGYIGKVLLQSLTEECKEMQQILQNSIVAAKANELTPPVNLGKGS